MKNKKKIGCLLGLVCLVLCACSRDTDIYLEEYGENTQEAESAATESKTTEETEADDAVQNNVCYVYICGAVERPGVYAMMEGSRIYEVIDVAGGMTEEADDTMVNQAEPVTDGMMIRIYTKDEAKEMEAEADGMAEGDAASDGKVNINSAGVAELMTLPGIGSAKAEAIVSYREEYGDFSGIEDLMNVPGIKEGTFRQMKEHIKVN